MLEAFHSGMEIEEIFFEGELDHDIAAAASMGTAALRPVFPGTLEATMDTVNPQPVVAVVGLVESDLQDLAADKPILVLVEVRDPGNVGTLIRTAEASGCAGVVLSGESVDPTNPKVVRASAGAYFRLPIVHAADPLSLFQELRAQGRTVAATVLADPDRDNTTSAADSGGEIYDYDQLDLRTAAIVLGNEAHGLSPEVANAAGTRTTIPLAGPTESLNVAAAGAVMCFASWQQRRQSPAN